MDDILEVTLLVAETLERLEVPYVVGGSLASSFHGIPRATVDADLVAALRQEHRPGFVGALRGAFYLEAEAIQRAIELPASFNVIHLETMLTRSGNGAIAPSPARSCAAAWPGSWTARRAEPLRDPRPVPPGSGG